MGVNVCVKAINVYCEKVGLVGNSHGSHYFNKMVRVFIVTGVVGGEGS